MNIDDAGPPPRRDEDLIAGILGTNQPVVLVSHLQASGGSVDRTRSLLASSGREVRITPPSDFEPADAHGAVVALFVSPDQAPALVRRAAAGGATAVWLGPGLVSAEARAAVEAVGVAYVEDRDLKLEFEVNVLGAPRRDFVPM